VRRYLWLCLALLLPVSAGAAEPVRAEVSVFVKVPFQDLPRVERNFRFLCAQCHGVNGDGKGPNASKQLEVMPADLTDGAYMAKFTDQQIFRTLTYGGPANNLSSLMPPWGNRLSEEERWELIRHIRKLCRCKGIGTVGPPPGMPPNP